MVKTIIVNITINSKHTLPLLIKIVLKISWLNKKTKTFIKNNGIVVNTDNIQLINDVITLYRKDLEPLLKQLRELKYKYCAIELNETDETFCLVRKSYTLDDMSVPFDEPNVINFQLGNKSNKLYESK